MSSFWLYADVRVCVCVCVLSMAVHLSPGEQLPVPLSSLPHNRTHSRAHTNTPASAHLPSYVSLGACLPTHICLYVFLCTSPQSSSKPVICLPSVSLSARLFVCPPDIRTHDGGGGGAHTCHLASPAEAPSSAKWQGHKMAAASWLWQNGSLGGLQQTGLKGPGSFQPVGPIKPYRPPLRVRGTDRSAAEAHKDCSAGPSLLENSGVGGVWRTARTRVCVCVCVSEGDIDWSYFCFAT